MLRKIRNRFFARRWRGAMSAFGGKADIAQEDVIECPDIGAPVATIWGRGGIS